MSILSINNPTLLDVAVANEIKGTHIVAELLSQTNQVLNDIVYVQCNAGMQHKEEVRTSLPDAEWRAFNSGVAASKASSAIETATCGLMETYSEIDKSLADMYQPGATRNSYMIRQEAAFIEAMGQKAVNAIFYGKKTNSEQFSGFSELYGSLTGEKEQNVINGGSASTDKNTSVWLVRWGSNSVFCVYPQNTVAGLNREHLGQDTKVYVDDDGVTRYYQVLRSHYQWYLGLMVKDWRNVVRIPNINTSEFAEMKGKQSLKDIDYAGNIIHLMTRAIHRIPAEGSGNLAFYVNRSVQSLLSRMAMEKSNYVLTFEKGAKSLGNPGLEMHFMGVPVRCVDAIKNDEPMVA